MPLPDQIERFLTQGIDPDALTRFVELFGEGDLDRLYSVCTKLKYFFNPWTLNEWELLCLTGNVELIRANREQVINVRGALGTLAEHYIALSGSEETLSWALENLDAPLAIDDKGRNIWYFAAASGSISCIELVLRSFPQLENSFSFNTLNVLDYASKTGSIDAMRYLAARYPHLVFRKDAWNINIVFHAAQSGSVQALREAISLYGVDALAVDRNMLLLVHAVSGGSVPVIDEVISSFPELVSGFESTPIMNLAGEVGSVEAMEFLRSKGCKNIKDDTGKHLLLSAALSGHPDAIKYVADTFPEFNLDPDKSGGNVILYAAMSGSVPAIQYALKRFPELENSVDYSGRNIVEYAMESGSMPVIHYVMNKFPELVEKASVLGKIFYAVMRSESYPAIAYIFERFGDSLNMLPEDMKIQLLHNGVMAASDTHSLKLIIYILETYPQYLNRTINDITILDYVVKGGFKDGIDEIFKRVTSVTEFEKNDTLYHAMQSGPATTEFLVRCYPSILSKILYSNKIISNFDSISMNNLHHPFSLELLVRTVVEESISDLLDPQFNKNYYRFYSEIINSFYYVFIRIVFSDPDKYVNQIFSSETLKSLNCINLIRSMIRLDSIASSMVGLNISVKEFREVMAAIFDDDATEGMLRVETPFILEMRRFLASLNKTPTRRLELSADEILALKVITDNCLNSDFANELDLRVCRIIRNSTQVSALLPKPRSSDLNITSDNHQVHMDTVKAAVLPGDELIILMEAVQHVIDNQDLIMEFYSSHHGKQYALPHGFFLNTDHIFTETTEAPVPELNELSLESTHRTTSRMVGKKPDSEAFKAYLHRLLSDFFSAFYIAREAGRQQGYFDILAIEGCFEGRIQTGVLWAANLVGIESIDALMRTYYAEYVSYSKVMDGKKGMELFNLPDTVLFISERHENFLCIPHNIYAPEGRVTSVGVQQYLIDVLGYDAPIPSGIGHAAAPA